MKRTLKLSAVATAIALSGIAHAATLSGVVTDISGNPIEGAAVSVHGSAKKALTDNKGRYVIENIQDGHVHVRVHSPRYVRGSQEFDNASGDLTANFVLQPSAIENIIVTANAFDTSVLESVTPVSVLTGDELRKRQATTIGETLKATPGVHNSYFGPVAGNPVIRGNDGPRVKITQNSLDVSDASRVGADHNIGAESANAVQIEVLRGPATLLYGSGAIGGVVNVVDNRVPSDLVDGTEGSAELRHETATGEEFAAINLNTSAGRIGFHFDAFDRTTDDTEIPGFADVDPEEDAMPGVLESSAADTQNITAGISYIGDSGYIGFSVQQLDNLYGIPGGHSHHHGQEHDEHEEDQDEEHDHDEEGEEIVQLDVDNRRYQVEGLWYSPFHNIDNVKLSYGYSDYKHVELEEGVVGTQFANETSELRLTAEHHTINGWHGVMGLHLSQSDFEAVGEEAFYPSSETDMFAVFIIEEKSFDNVTVQLGARYEKNTLSASPFDVPLGHQDGHDDHHDDEDHEEHHDDDHHDEGLTEIVFPELDYQSLSLSAGANWEYAKGYSLAVNLSRSERAPTEEELFSAGTHLATQTFDLGLSFITNEEGEIETRGGKAEEEVATNIDLTWRKFSGDWGFTVTAFYNQVDDYLYQVDTGFTFGGEHEEHDDDHHDEHGDDNHDDGHEDEHGHEGEEEGLPILNFRQSDADLYGFEAEIHYQLSDIWNLQMFADYIRADTDNGDLARIPPLRVGGEVAFSYQGWNGDFGVTWYDDQTNTAEFETATKGYTLIEAGVDYSWYTQNVNWLFFLRGTNLTDKEARVHTSFLADRAPLPGRGFTLGVKATF
ncbi:TonB-dependent receptor [Alteromonas sediminis]|uniref:TonB-dependent receptor n=1 Tax=Alteromonas sediminis TaxID=2259342 RepID=A0A3N5ZBL4_9ALTE|nr:TonB-dependent receptor [Alteromonas sediminis]RPJ67028.1 TonB-dependent receptor [Alteromonas sediminis]